MSYPMNTLPLRDDDSNKPNVAPNSGPEVIDLEPTASVIDDGLLPPNRPDGKPGINPVSRRGRRPPSDIQGFPDYPGEPERVSVLHYTPSCKVIMMCIALLTANLVQLMYILENGGDGPSYYFILIMISLSLFLQVAAFLGLIFLDLYKRGEFWKVYRLQFLMSLVIQFILYLNLITSLCVGHTLNKNSGATENN